MVVTEAVKEGWDFYSKYGGAAVGADAGAAYVGRVEDAIQALNDEINAFSTNNQAAEQLKGFIAEAWHS